MRRWLALLLASAVVAGLMAPAAVTAQVVWAFDGRWEVTLSCPPRDEDDDDAKGYAHHFTARVAYGALRGEFGVAGQPGWHMLTGNLAPDGSAELTLEGIAPATNSARAKAYTDTVSAQFGMSHGSGERAGKPKCELEFRRS